MQTDFSGLEDYYSNLQTYFHVTHEKEYVIPSWFYIVFFITGIFLTYVSKWGIFLLLISTYKLSRREAKREAFIEGFNESKELLEEAQKDSATLREKMIESIEFWENR